MQLPQRFQAVYCVQDTEKFNPIAIRPMVKEKWVEWEDTGHGSSMFYEKLLVNDHPVAKGEPIPEKPDKIEMIDAKGNCCTLIKLTKELFDMSLRAKTVGQLNFENDSALQKYYLETNFNIY